MARQTSQTEDKNLPASKETDVLDRVKSILSPLKGDRWLAVAVYGSLTTIGLAIGTLAWKWSDLQTNPSEQSKKRFDASLSAVSTGATIAAGIVLFLNFRVANRNAEIAQNKLDQDIDKARQDADLAQKKLDQDINKAKSDEKLAESRLKMERFNKAVEMLGKNDSIHLRLGGIYALESIAADSDKDTPDENYRQVLEVLTAFVRENAPYPPKEQAKKEDQPQTTEQLTEAGAETAAELSPLPTDIQAVLTVLKRRKHKDKDWEQYPLDLRKADLGRADHLKGVNLRKASLWEANLQGASLWEANLQGASLWKANLQEANLVEANLQEADLVEANLQRTVFVGAELQKAKLKGANLQEAVLEGAKLQKANLVEAKLQKAVLEGANLHQADLTRTNLRGASFWNAQLIETALAEAKEDARVNLQSAKNWETAQYDPEIREWLGLLPENPSVE